MKELTSYTREFTYINSMEQNAYQLFSERLENYLNNKINTYHTLVILCIGTDRATGDSLGPLIGYKLKNLKHDKIKVYGDLEYPVHAKNLAETIDQIYKTHTSPFIVAIDACLGKIEHIGYLTLGEGSITPGTGVNKSLPSVGDIFISGIVNFSGALDGLILQNTRLNLVMNMADIIAPAILNLVAYLDEKIADVS